MEGLQAMTLREKLIRLNGHLGAAREHLKQAEAIANEKGLSFSFEGYDNNTYNSKVNETVEDDVEENYDESDDYYESSDYYASSY
jgi:hypothetical protein